MIDLRELEALLAAASPDRWGQACAGTRKRKCREGGYLQIVPCDFHALVPVLARAVLAAEAYRGWVLGAGVPEDGPVRLAGLVDALDAVRAEMGGSDGA